MKNKYSFAMLILACVCKLGMAQQTVAAWYTFGSSSSTYNSLNGTGTVLGSNTNDDDIFNNVPIGFTFDYAQQPITQVAVNANGYIKMGATLNNYSTDAIDDSGGDDSVVCAMNRDLVSNTAGVLSYTTTGTAPNRVFTVEWSDYTRPTGGTPDDYFFQINLYETSNIIEVAYGTQTVSRNSKFQVGLRGGSTNDFNNVSVVNGTNTWSTPTGGTSNVAYSETRVGPPALAPASGQRFTWTPPPNCSGTPAPGALVSSIGTTVCVGQIVTLQVASGITASGLNFQWQSSTNGTSWSAIPSATDAAYSSSFSTPLYYQVIVGCASATAASGPINLLATAPIAYATVPFLEDFDNVWQGRCDIRNVPTNAFWDSYPTTTDSSWRRQDDGVSANWTAAGTATVSPLAGAGCANFHSYYAAAGTTGELNLYVNMGNPNAQYTASFYHTNLDGDDSLEVYLSTDGGSTFTKQGYAYLSGDYNAIEGSWNQKVIKLGLVNSATSVIRFKAYSDFGGSDIAIDSMQIISCLMPTVTVSSATVCPGAITSLTASGATTYSWSSGATTSVISVSPLVSTNYTVTGFDNGCQDTATAVVSILPGPSSLSIAATKNVICAGENVGLFATGASNYTWSTGATTPGLNLSPASNTVYVVTGQSVTCSRNFSISITVNPLPVIAITTTPAIICAGDTTSLIGSGANTYTWSSGPNTASIAPIPATTTTYVLLGTDGNGCIGSDTSIITVNPGPVLVVPNLTLCSTNSGVITASGASSYTWSNGTNGPVLTVNTTSNTTFTVTGKANGCRSVKTVSVILGTAVSLTVTATNTLICSGDTVLLTASGATSYLWDSNFSTPSITVSPLSNTTYTVSGGNGNCYDTTNISLQVKASPTINVSSSAYTVCPGNPATLSAGGAFSYSWSATSTIASSIVVTPTATTVYTVVGTGTNSCKSTFTLTETVSPCTGIDAISSNATGISVYPNPNNGSFIIQASGSAVKTIHIVDVTGRVVFNAESNEANIPVDITTLSNGIYVILIKQAGTDLQTIKMIKD